MTFALATFVVVGFAGLLHLLDLPTYAREAGQRGQKCTEIVRDSSMDDRAKEEALQNQARRLFILLGILGGGSLLAIGLPVGAVWILDLMGIASVWDVFNMLERLDFLAGTVIVGGLGYALVQYSRG